MTKNTGISNGLAKWMEDFVLSLNSINSEKMVKKAEGENTTVNIDTEDDSNVTPYAPEAPIETVEYFDEKTAAINIADLPKIVWNDETFYVLFDEESGKATILNEFTNVVTTVSAKTIEEVDDALNGLQIVKSNVDCELEKNASEKTDEEMMDEVEEADEVEEVEEVPTPVNDVEQNEEVQEEVKEDSKDDIINQMQSQIDNLTEQINILQQQYARSQELSNLDIGAQELEVQHFNETAEETAQQISEDNNVDITTPQGRSQLRQKLLDQLDEADDSINSGNESVEEVNEIDVTLDNNEEIENESENAESDQDDEQAEPIKFESPAVVDEQNFMEDSIDQDNKLDDFSEEEIKEDTSESEETEDDEEFEKLSGKDVNIFKKAVCPNCGGDLVKANKLNNIQGIYCNGECHSEYAVNMDNEDIYKKRGVK